MSPELGTIRREQGVAGQYAYHVDVTYPGESTERVTFVSRDYSDRVLMIHPAIGQAHVDDPERFGPFGPAWVRRFYGQES